MIDMSTILTEFNAYLSDLDLIIFYGYQSYDGGIPDSNFLSFYEGPAIQRSTSYYATSVNKVSGLVSNFSTTEDMLWEQDITIDIREVTKGQFSPGSMSSSSLGLKVFQILKSWAFKKEMNSLGLGITSYSKPRVNYFSDDRNYFISQLSFDISFSYVSTYSSTVDAISSVETTLTNVEEL